MSETSPLKSVIEATTEIRIEEPVPPARIKLITGLYTGSLIKGTPGADRLVGGLDDDTLDGLGGNDTLNGYLGSDVLYGGAGDDVLDPGFGPYDQIYGGSGTDTIVIANLAAVEFTGGTFALVHGTASKDASYVEFSGVEKLIVNNKTIDIFSAALNFDASKSTNQVIIGGSSQSQNLVGSLAGSTIFGVGGDDTINGIGGGILDGGDGNDRLIGSTATSTQLIGGDGNDTIWGGSQNDVIKGDAGSDLLFGGAGADEIDGGGGKDTIYGGQGNDTITVISFLFTAEYSGATVDGGDGADVVSIGDPEANFYLQANATGFALTYANAEGALIDGQLINVEKLSFASTISLLKKNGSKTSSESQAVAGGSAKDLLFGGKGDDVIFGNAGNDTISSDAGNDTIEGGAGSDVIDGGAGTDTVIYKRAETKVDINLATGLAKTTGSQDTLKNIEVVFGSTFVDSITGGTGNDYLNGWSGNDTINGGGGADTLDGSLGNDLLFGEAGNDTFNYVLISPETSSGRDTLVGGAGVDTFKISSEATFSGFDVYVAGTKVKSVDGFSLEKSLSLKSTDVGYVLLKATGETVNFSQIEKIDWSTSLL